MATGAIGIGSDVLLPAVTAYDQGFPASAQLADGRFVVVWGDVGTQRAQIFSADGAAIGAPIEVSKGHVAEFTSVTGLADGGFVVTWSDDGSATGDTQRDGVSAQIFSADGTKQGRAFLVNTEIDSFQASPSVAALPGGGFVVVWSDYSNKLGDTDGNALVAQIFSADGQKVGEDFRVNTYTAGYQFGPVTAALSNGSFVVAWGDGSDTLGDKGSTSIKAQMFSATGGKIGGEFLVNTTTSGNQDAPAITALADGRFVAAWFEYPPGGTTSTAIRAQIFSAQGTKLGGEFIVATANATDDVFNPSLAALANGGFVASWSSGPSSVNAQVYNADGTKLGDVFTAHPPTEVEQTGAVVLGLSNGNFAISWINGELPFDELAVSTATLIDTRVFRPDLPPVITSNGGTDLAVLSRPENVASVTTVSARGQLPKGDLVYSIAGGADAAMFTIDPRTGALSFIAAPDFEAPADAGADNRYDVTVRVSDGYQSDTQALTVTVLNVNEISGTPGTDRLIGTDGEDAITGKGGDDYLAGKGDDDILDGGAGADKMLGGAGNDTYHVDSAGDRVYETVTSAATDSTDAGGTDTVISAVSFSLAGGSGLRYVERLTLDGTAGINGTGNALANIIRGNDGTNVLSGGAGDDILYGNLGNDRLDGGTGADRMSGGGGNDRYIVDNAGDRVFETVATSSSDAADAGGTDTVDSSVSFTLGRYVENLTLRGDLAINGTGNDGANVLTGNGAGNVLQGGAGRDTLIGGAGDDRLAGGIGTDTLTGGTGRDTFLFDAGATDARNRDVITDFSHAQGDRILLSKAMFGGFSGTGTLTADEFHAGAGVVRAHDASDRIIYDTATGALYFDADGQGGLAAVRFATLGTATHPTLDYSDIQIIA